MIRKEDTKGIQNAINIDAGIMMKKDDTKDTVNEKKKTTKELS